MSYSHSYLSSFTSSTLPFPFQRMETAFCLQEEGKAKPQRGVPQSLAKQAEIQDKARQKRSAPSSFKIHRL